MRRLSLDAFFHSAASKTACDDPSHVTRGSEVTLQLNNLIDVRRWILACGSHAEVLDPPELRREITEEIQRTAANYHLKSRICPEQ